MGIVIEVDFIMRWRKPVFVGDGDMLTQMVIGPGEAIAFMKSNFRYQGGASYARAWRRCHDAVEGKVHAASARKWFVLAYAEDCVRSSWEGNGMQAMEGEI
jgi:hypothetical protein